MHNEWFSEREMLVGKNNDEDDLNFIIQNQIDGDRH